jgi:hypothetical protein
MYFTPRSSLLSSLFALLFSFYIVCVPNFCLSMRAVELLEAAQRLNARGCALDIRIIHHDAMESF